MEHKLSKMIVLNFLVVLYFLCVDGVAIAHGIVDARIDQLTELLLENPSQTQFLLERGVLYTQHMNWQKARADFHAVRCLDRAGSIVDYYEANLWLSANRPELSYQYVNRYLANNPENVSALQLRAETHDRLGRTDAAINDYTRVIEISNTVLPSMYLNLARAQTKVKSLNQQQVHQTILSGLEKLGPLAVLIEYVIEFDRQRQDYQSALKWFEQLPERLREQPYWVIEKAILLAALGRADDAKLHYKKANDGLRNKRRSGRFSHADRILLRKIQSLI